VRLPKLIAVLAAALTLLGASDASAKKPTLCPHQYKMVVRALNPRVNAWSTTGDLTHATFNIDMYGTNKKAWFRIRWRPLGRGVVVTRVKYVGPLDSWDSKTTRGITTPKGGARNTPADPNAPNKYKFGTLTICTARK
jgi:hypothetical protein